MKHIFFYLLLLSLFSCKKSNIDEHALFVGNWHGSDASADYDIIITSKGKATYEKVTSNTETFVKGKFQLKDGDELKIGLKKFKLNQYPIEVGNSDSLIMKVDNVSYFRKK